MTFVENFEIDSYRRVCGYYAVRRGLKLQTLNKNIINYLSGRVSGRIHCRELSSFRFLDHCSVFQPEVAVIKVAVDLLPVCDYPLR